MGAPQDGRRGRTRRRGFGARLERFLFREYGGVVILLVACAVIACQFMEDIVAIPGEAGPFAPTLSQYKSERRQRDKSFNKLMHQNDLADAKIYAHLGEDVADVDGGGGPAARPDQEDDDERTEGGRRQHVDRKRFVVRGHGHAKKKVEMIQKRVVEEGEERFVLVRNVDAENRADNKAWEGQEADLEAGGGFDIDAEDRKAAEDEEREEDEAEDEEEDEGGEGEGEEGEQGEGDAAGGDDGDGERPVGGRAEGGKGAAAQAQRAAQQRRAEEQAARAKERAQREADEHHRAKIAQVKEAEARRAREAQERDERRSRRRGRNDDEEAEEGEGEEGAEGEEGEEGDEGEGGDEDDYDEEGATRRRKGKREAAQQRQQTLRARLAPSRAIDRRNVSLFEGLLRASAPLVLEGVKLGGPGRSPGRPKRLTMSREQGGLGMRLQRRSGVSSQEELVALLPESDHRVRYKRCAIVGNSGINLKHVRGHTIDEYDAVLRYNNAPTSTFERFVGTKTTYRIINNAWSRFAAKKKSWSPHDNRDRTHLLCFGNSSVRMFIKFRKMYPERSTLYVAPEVTKKARSLYKKLHARMEQAGFGPYEGGNVMPSGFEGLIFMTQVCDQLHVYGFDPQRDRGIKYHYFDDVQGVTKVHSFSFEFEMLHLLHLTRHIKLCVPGYVSHYECPDEPAKSNEFSSMWSDS